MWWIDATGHVAYGLIFLGSFLVMRKHAIGWLCYVVGDFMWLCLGWELKLSSIWAWEIVFLTQSAYNWRRWRKGGA